MAGGRSNTSGDSRGSSSGPRPEVNGDVDVQFRLESIPEILAMFICGRE